MRNFKYVQSIILLALVFALCNCTMHERKYRKGYYVEWNKSKTLTKTKDIESKPTKLINLDVTKSNTETKSANKKLLCSLKDSSIQLVLVKKMEAKKIPVDSCGDLIIMLDGRVIEAKVIEVNQSTVKYKKCNNMDGPTYTSALEQIERIQYKDGSQDIVDSGIKPSVRFIPKGLELKYKAIGESKSKNHQQNTSNKAETSGYNPTAIASFVFGLLSFLILPAIITGPIALILGVVANNQISNGNGNKGRGLATFGIVIGAIVLFVLLIFLFAVLL